MNKKLVRRIAAAAAVVAVSVGSLLLPASSAQALDTDWPLLKYHASSDS